MNILVLGGNGFIGSHLVDKMLSEGHNVTVFDKFKEYFRNPLKDVKYIFGDFGNREAIKDSLKGIDIVFHLISTTNPKTSNDDLIFDIMSNVVNTINLLEECVKSKISKLVFISSGGTIYGIPHNLPVTESDEKNPICSYGITKLMIEKYISLFNLHYGLNYNIIRPSNPYGERQNPKGNQGIISVFLNKVINGNPIEIWGDGEIVRDYIYVKDLVDGIYITSMNNDKAGVYNIGSGKGYTINDIIGLIKRISGIDFSVIYKPSRNFDVPKIFLDISKVKEKFDWQPQVDIQEGIKRTFSYLMASNSLS